MNEECDHADLNSQGYEKCPICSANLGPSSHTLDPVVECDHDWEEHPDSMFSNEYEADVRCTKCGMPGSQNRKTGKVMFPAT